MKLEALVGHLYIIGGRSLQAKPPGTLIELPPRRAPRSREEDTLFVLITAAGRKQLPIELYNELATLGADAYFRSRVGVTGALRDGVSAINKRLYNTEFRAGAVLLAKRADEVYAARCGTTLVAHRGKNTYETFPGDPDLLNILPLGSRSEPTVEFSLFKLGPDDIFVMGDAGFATVTDNVLQACINRGEVNQVLDQLEAVITKQATATIIQFVLPESELATAQPPATPQTQIPPAEQPVVIPRTSVLGRPAPQPSETDVLVEEPQAEKKPSILEIAQVVPEVDEEGYLKYAEAPTGVDEQIAEAAEPASEPELEAPQPTLKRVEPRIKTTTSVKPKKQRKPTVIAKMLGVVGRSINTVLARFLPEPEDEMGRERIPLSVGIMIAIFIPVVIAIVAVGFSISDQGTTVFEQQRMRAIAAYDEAVEYASTDAADHKTARDLFIIAKGHAADALRNNPEDDGLINIFRQSQLKIDEYDRANRIQVTKLTDFNENADLRGPIIANGVDLYVLDRNRSQVYLNTLNSNGDSILGDGTETIIQRGQAIGELTVSNLVDIEWMDQGGTGQPNVVVALDENGLLAYYTPVFPPALAIQLRLPQDWRRPVAVATWSVNFYVLDAGANQIWKYVPVNAYYTAAPEEYFTGADRPDLSTAVDFAIDFDGAVYILFADGHIEKFIGGQRERFEFYEAPVDGIGEARALYVDNDPTSYALYVAGRESEAVYQVSFGGTINAGYRPANPPLEVFDRLSGVYVDSSRGYALIYALSGNSLYLISP
ncbi:MAG: hypothetical protein L0154_15670 [Chloroflexi bacterium]|nr:hypothetical protein [Chloroflexota bacterium]